MLGFRFVYRVHSYIEGINSLLYRHYAWLLPFLACLFTSVGWAAPKNGIYITPWVASSTRFDTLIKKAQGTRVNAIIIHIKDEFGSIYIPCTHPLSQNTGTSRIIFGRDKLARIVVKAHDAGLYVIGKIDCFKNKQLAGNCPRLAVLSKKNGDIWRDERDMAWVDPYAEELWDLNIAIAEEIAAAGFDEIQFDYVRFPDGGTLSDCYYPHNIFGKTRSWAIESFLKKAVEALQPYKVKVSADLFGITCWQDVSRVLGQHLGRVGAIVDYVYPMVYPSHFPSQFYREKEIHYSEPYKIIYQSTRKGKKMLEGTTCGLRPWIQGFDYRVKDFGPQYIIDQIKAAEDAGSDGWYVWNARCDYSVTWQALEQLK